jgi:FlaG/FlaF family flagellin (archaellin)
MTKKSRWNQAVSEVLDIVLLLGITIALFAFLNYIVFSYSFNESSPSISLIGSIDKANNMIYIEHNGGEPLTGNTDVIITIESDIYQNTSSKLLRDVNGDTKWNIGEIVQFNSPRGITDNLFIKVLVVDPSTNTLVLSAVLQQGK